MFIDLIRKRRSIRLYQDKKIESEKIELLKEAALRSPSSRNLNPWEFIFVTDSDLLEKLKLSKAHGSEFVNHAALAVIVLADPSKCDVWIEDCSIASIYLILQAHDLGLGACWIQIRERNSKNNLSSENYIKNLLKIPEHLKVESIISIGYPNESLDPLSFKDLDYDKIFFNLYQK